MDCVGSPLATPQNMNGKAIHRMRYLGPYHWLWLDISSGEDKAKSMTARICKTNLRLRRV